MTSSRQQNSALYFLSEMHTAQLPLTCMPAEDRGQQVATEQIGDPAEAAGLHTPTPQITFDLKMVHFETANAVIISKPLCCFRIEGV